MGISTIILSAVNAISAQQAIAMALPATIALVGGLVYMIVLDPWTAWQRGFQQGCQASAPCQLRALDPGPAAAPARDDAAQASRSAPPLNRAELRRV